MTLTEMRDRKELSQTDVSRLCHEVDPEFPATPAAVSAIERRGTTNYWHIRALAFVYGFDLHIVAEAAKPGGSPKRASFGRGRRVAKKNPEEFTQKAENIVDIV